MRLPPYWSIKRNLKIQLLEHLEGRDRRTTAHILHGHFHVHQFLVRLQHLVHQALVLDGQAHGGLCVIPTGIGRVLLGPALEAPSTATGPAIRYLSGRDRRASASRARPRGPGVPVLNPEETLAIRVLGPLCPDRPFKVSAAASLAGHPLTTSKTKTAAMMTPVFILSPSLSNQLYKVSVNDG